MYPIGVVEGEAPPSDQDIMTYVHAVYQESPTPLLTELQVIIGVEVIDEVNQTSYKLYNIVRRDQTEAPSDGHT